MSTNFWEQLEKPVFVIAPMADVTDAAFREMFAKYGKPDVMWTEFVSADGLFLAPEQGREFWLPEELRAKAVKHGIAPDNPLLKDLIFSDMMRPAKSEARSLLSERPIVAQFFSRDPERMARAAAFAEDLGYDGVDINMGCPAKVIVNQGAGCAMIKEPAVAREVILATKQATSLPVSVKTRIGFNANQLEEWLPEILREEPAVVTMHARTRRDMSKVPARWEHIQECVAIRDEMKSNALILGNGDVESLEDARRRVRESGADGAMVGRGIFGNPFFFNRDKNITDLSIPERLEIMLEHTYLFEKYLGDTKNFYIMKKHFKAYVNGFDGAKELRAELMNTENADEVEEIVKTYS